MRGCSQDFLSLRNVKRGLCLKFVRCIRQALSKIQRASNIPNMARLLSKQLKTRMPRMTPSSSYSSQTLPSSEQSCCHVSLNCTMHRKLPANIRQGITFGAQGRSPLSECVAFVGILCLFSQANSRLACMVSRTWLSCTSVYQSPRPFLVSQCIFVLRQDFLPLFPWPSRAPPALAAKAAMTDWSRNLLEETEKF